MQERVENHLKSLLIKHFDPQKADSIFTVEGEVRSVTDEFHSHPEILTYRHSHLTKVIDQPFCKVLKWEARKLH